MDATLLYIPLLNFTSRVSVAWIYHKNQHAHVRIHHISYLISIISSYPSYLINMPNKYTNAIKKHHQYIYTVPYSDHSCFPEIVEFVKLLCPSHIKGIVSSSSSYIDPCYYLRNIYGTSSLYSKPEVKERRGRVEGKRDSCIEKKLKRKRIREYQSCLHKTRVSLLRRFKCGVKLSNED